MKRKPHILAPMLLFLLWAATAQGEPKSLAQDHIHGEAQGQGQPQSQPLNPLDGPAFTDPDELADMPMEWQQRTIVYDDWSANADVAVTFDQQIYQMLEPLTQEFARAKKLKIATREGTCGISSGMVTRKQVDVAAFCCPPARIDRLPDLAYHTLGIAAVAALVHPQIPVDGVSLEELQAIFQGERYFWSEVKVSEGSTGPRLPIQTIGRLHCPLRPGHWRLLLKDADQFSHRLQEVGTIPDMLFNVVSTPGAIGYETLWHMERYKEKGLPRALKINGADPTSEPDLLSGRYPLYRVFNLTTWSRDTLRNRYADELVAYLLKSGDKLDRRFGLIPATRLRDAGWGFHENELINTPEKH